MYVVMSVALNANELCPTTPFSSLSQAYTGKNNAEEPKSLNPAWIGLIPL